MAKDKKKKGDKKPVSGDRKVSAGKKGSKKGDRNVVADTVRDATDTISGLIDRGGAVAEAVTDVVRVGQQTVEQVGHDIARAIATIMGRGKSQVEESVKKAGQEISTAFEAQVRKLIAELDLPTRAELKAMSDRLATLELPAKTAKPAARKAAVKKAVTKTAVTKTAATKAAATKTAPAKATTTGTAKAPARKSPAAKSGSQTAETTGDTKAPARPRSSAKKDS